MTKKQQLTAAESVEDVSRGSNSGPARLTRSQVAAELGISTSSVVRMEGKTLHPTVGPRGVRHFDPNEVRQLAAAGAVPTKRLAKPRCAQDFTDGELSAAAFERFDQRQSLSEIVRALKVTPARVRKLYHQWGTSLWRGELTSGEPSDFVATSLTSISTGSAEQLTQLPRGEPTRISVARIAKEEHYINEHPYRMLDELGGFVVHGPIIDDNLRTRYGAGRFRVTAYNLTNHCIRWEVIVTL